MTTLNLNLTTENKPKLIFAPFTNTKRSQWGKYRRYALQNSYNFFKNCEIFLYKPAEKINLCGFFNANYLMQIVIDFKS